MVIAMTPSEAAEIRIRAFELWAEAGFPEGQEQHFWERALREFHRAKAVALRARAARAEIRTLSARGEWPKPRRRNRDKASRGRGSLAR